jgi:hypothetical protein
MSGRPNNAGIYNYDNLNAQNLFIKGKRFEDYITELVFEDQFEQGEIEEIKLLLQYLNTTGLSSEWIVDNNNKNQDLKTLITALQTKLANIDTTALTQSSVLTDTNRNSVLKTAIDNLITRLTNIDTTALTQSSVLTDDNRNSVLKTRIDGNDGSLSTLNDKTRFINQSTVGSNAADPKTANTFSVNVNTNPTGIHKGDLSIQAGFNLIRMKNNSTTLQDINYNDNQMTIMSPNGMISSDAHLNRMMATDKIEIGNLGTQSSAAINIGGKGAQINIGSIDTTAIGETNTIITIGKRTVTRNTETYHKGNQYIAEARWEDLPVTTGISLSNIYALLSGSAPSYVLGAFVATAGGFNYSDILHMNLSNPLQKNKDITTSKGITLDSLKIFDNNAISLGFPKISTYFVNGDIISTQVVGDNTTSVFSGKIKLENHNTLNPVNINWAFSQDDDNVNTLDIKGDDGIFLHQGASAVNQPLRIINSCGSGGIELKVGGSSTEPASRGRKEHAVGGLFLRQSNQLNCAITKEPPDESLFGFKRKTNNNNAKVDYRLLVSCNADEPASPLNFGAQQNHGIVVYNEAKHQAIDDAAIASATQPVYLEYTAIDEDNVTTPSLTILGNYAGPTTNTLYKNADNKLFWNGEQLATSVSGGGGGGLEYYIPLASNITNPAPNPTEIISTLTYTSAPQRTITQSTTAVGAGIRMARYTTDVVNKISNPFVEGVQTIQQYVIWNQNNTIGQLYGQAWFQASATANNFLYERTFTAGVTTNGFQELAGTPIGAPRGLFNLSVNSVVFPNINIDTFNGLTMTLKCRLEGQNLITGNWSTLQTSTNTITYTLDNQNDQTLTFNETFTINQTTPTAAPMAYRFVLFMTSASNTGQIIQTNSGDVGGTQCAYRLGSGSGTSSIRVLLYDGVNAKQTITHTDTPYLVPIELPISPPYQIDTFNNSRLSFDLFMFQPSGAVNSGHQMIFFFGDGAISHIETTINEPPAPIPTLSSVMTSGNQASTTLNMNNNGITNVASIQGWNVKDLTAGTGISISNTSGNYTITNNAPAPPTPTISAVLTAGNAAGNQSITGVNAITATTVNATNIPNWNVKQITGAGNITVSNNGAGTYLISSDNMGGHESSADDFAITAASANTARKPSWYGNVWLRRADAMVNTNTCFDVYMSANGKIIAFAHKDSNDDIQRPIVYSTDFGTSYSSGNVSKNWVSICGTTMGEDIYAIQGRSATNNSVWPREIWRSNSRGATWSQNPSPPDFANSRPTRIRCSGDGKYQLVNDTRTGALGKLYKSNDYGASWTSVNITAATSWVMDMAISATGQVQYLVISGTSQLTTADQGNGGIYRSLDFGATWAYIYTTGVNDILYHIDCDATGRIVVFSNVQGVFVSRNYGNTWSAQISIYGANNISISPNGNIIWVACIGAASSTAQLYYSDDYGHTFTARNQTPDGSYQSTAYQAIATNNDGTILVGGGQYNFNSCRQFPNEVAQIVAGIGITATGSEGSLTLTTGFTGVPHSTYFANINVSTTGFTALPTNMNLQLYDYILDFSIVGLQSNTWIYLRFNDDSGGLISWDSSLIFNPVTTTQGTINIASAVYRNDVHGVFTYWLNSGTTPSATVSNPIQLKASYKISAVDSTCFVVSLEQCQPVSIIPSLNNIAPYYQVFASQIKYRYSNNHVSRWAPQNIGFFSGATPFTNLNCCIRQCIRSTVGTNHVV